MSMYDMMLGQYPLAKELIKALELDSLGRIRDCYFNISCDKIVLLTRNGGPNRPDFQEVFDQIKTNQYYLSDNDAEIDPTYAEIYFSIPDNMRELAIQCKEMGLGYPSFEERFNTTFNKLRIGNKDDPEVKQIFKNFNPILERIRDLVGEK